MDKVEVLKIILNQPQDPPDIKITVKAVVVKEGMARRVG